MAKLTSALCGGQLIMTFAYSYDDGWRKFAMENFTNLIKLRTLNLAKFSLYMVLKCDIETFASVAL